MRILLELLPGSLSCNFPRSTPSLLETICLCLPGPSSRFLILHKGSYLLFLVLWAFSPLMQVQRGITVQYCECLLLYHYLSALSYLLLPPLQLDICSPNKEQNKGVKAMPWASSIYCCPYSKDTFFFKKQFSQFFLEFSPPDTPLTYSRPLGMRPLLLPAMQVF